MNDLIRAIEELGKSVASNISEEPKKSDYEKLGEYAWARTLYRRFPKKLNEPADNELECSQELKTLWSWGDGEVGEGLIFEGLTFLSYKESREIFLQDFYSSPVKWYRSKRPIFSLSKGGDICFCESDKNIYLIDFEDDWVYLLSDNLEKFIHFLSKLVIAKKSKATLEEVYIHGLAHDYSIQASEAGLLKFYPFTKNKITRFLINT